MKAVQYRSKTVIDHQCILCFEYEVRCPASGFSYAIGQPAAKENPDNSRRAFLVQGILFAGGLLTGAFLTFSGRDKSVVSKPQAAGAVPEGSPAKAGLLRPPGVADVTRFVQRCLRCFQCVQSCPNRIIKISGLQDGLNSVFTPHLVFEQFGCDYNCQVCQLVCPNFAIPKQTLEEKQRAVIGIAAIDEKRCVVYAQDTNCLVCEEFCPVPEKAIKVLEKKKFVNGKDALLRYPVMDHDLCIGCGICEANCPTTPTSIVVKKA